MKKILKIVKWTLFYSILMVGLVYGIAMMVPIEGITEKQETNVNALISCNGGEVKVDNQLKLGEGLWKPISKDSGEIYCIEPGTNLATYGNNPYPTKADIQRLVSLAQPGTGPSACRCAPNVDYYGTESDTYYACAGVNINRSGQYGHIRETSTWTDRNGVYYNNLYDIGFIASWLPDGEMKGEMWDAAKQQAIWMSQISEKDYNRQNSDKQSQIQGAELIKYATRYKTFYERIMQQDSNGKTGMKPESKIPQEQVKLDIDQKEGIGKLGPFNLNYVNGKNIDGANDPYGWFSYGGISDMYLLDEAGNRINIKNFIINGKVKKVYNGNDKRKEEYTFFSAWDSKINRVNENYIDWYAYQKAAPQPNQEFYIEFEYPENIIGSVKLHVQFQYLKCEAQLCLRDGFKYVVDQTHKGDYNPHCDGHTRPGCNCGRWQDDDGHWHGSGCDGGHPCGWLCCHSCYGYRPRLGTNHPYQNGVYIGEDAHLRSLVTEEFEMLINDLFTTTMKIGGNVFEDVQETKENVTDGLLSDKDVKLSNVQVSLYEVNSNGTLTLAKLATLKQEQPKATQDQIDDEKDYRRRINPTLTDSNGYYEFRGVNPIKSYVIKFTYNGQEYLPTDYLKGANTSNVSAMVSNGQYSSCTDNNLWKNTSKGTELNSERDQFNARFASIDSSPENYTSPNTLGKTGTKNKTYSQLKLMGYALNSNGEYSETSQQLIDGYLYNKDGSISTTYSDGMITKKIKEYIRTYRKYPDENAMKNVIYQSIAGSNLETWRMLQFIEDCKINAWTKNQSTSTVNSFDKYPVYQQFTNYVSSGNKYPNNSYQNGTYQNGVSVYQNHTLAANGVKGNAINDNRNPPNDGYNAVSKGAITYKNIYQGQLQINLGLWKRQKADIALKKDVYKATLKINGRTEIYRYNDREVTTEDERNELKNLEKQYGRDSEEYLNYQLELENKYWDINTRIIGNNYTSYYGTKYDRQLYKSDQQYDGDNNLEAYITYKVSVRNQSQSIQAQIDEIVDYYDSTYTFEPNLSWVMYKDNALAEGETAVKTENDKIRITDQDFYDIMESGNKNSLEKSKYRDIALGKYNTTTGEYSANTRFSLGSNYNSLYSNGLSDHKLQTGETGYLYLTFKVNGSGNSLKIENNNTSAGKQNIAEINGYSTFYKNGTKLPNNVTINNETTVAGIVDQDSNPGNFTKQDLDNKTNSRYEQNFEDDADRARGINVYVDNNLIRDISGTIWEDKRNYQSNGTDAVIGNGVKDNNAVKISGIRVELHEVINGKTQEDVAKIYNGSRWISASTTTDTNGDYKFNGYIPGDYIVRFIYGGQYNAKYNGQDYKSTSYQYDYRDGGAINQSGRTDVSGDDSGYLGYTDYNNQNKSATYGYNIYRSDTYGKDLSDAKDIWKNRLDINSYSSNQYSGVTYDKANTLNQNTLKNSNTQMIAETGAIRMEFEYNRQASEGNNGYNNNGYRDTSKKDAIDYKDYTNTKYSLENVDLGLEERPKAGLELNKQVSNVKIILANQSILFDAKESVNNLIWKSKTAYNINKNYKQKDENNNIYNDYNNYDNFRNSIIRHISSLTKNSGGLIQATMDEELMHGATIQITYDMTVTNIGEVDYNETQFYYIGKVSNTNSIVHTSADVIIDYVKNNLKFRTDSNDDSWKTISKTDINSNNYVNAEVSNELKDFNTIITTTGLSKKLIPLESTKNKLILTQLITSQNKEDDLNYKNISEIVKISNDVGRRMAYSVQGNQNPNELPTEPDSSIAETVKILPPFGIGDIVIYVSLGLGVLAILAVGIIFIKKKVMK